MLQSEQLDTRLVLAANDQVAAGPADPAPAGRGRGQPGRRRGRGAAQRGRDRPDEAFNRIAHARGDADARRAADAGRRHVLHRLFWEETLRRLRAAAATFRLHLLARACARHAARPGPRESESLDRRARRGRDRLRVLWRAVPLRRSRRGRDVHAGAEGTTGSAAAAGNAESAGARPCRLSWSSAARPASSRALPLTANQRKADAVRVHQQLAQRGVSTGSRTCGPSRCRPSATQGRSSAVSSVSETSVRCCLQRHGDASSESSPNTVWL
jgi:hypothetical protein